MLETEIDFDSAILRFNKDRTLNCARGIIEVRTKTNAKELRVSLENVYIVRTDTGIIVYDVCTQVF
jgi:hypothetical protein